MNTYNDYINNQLEGLTDLQTEDVKKMGFYRTQYLELDEKIKHRAQLIKCLEKQLSI